jgi:hypothetical protein
LSKSLVRCFELGIHIPVDDLREWVVSGLAHPVPWTEESEHQFRIAEEVTCAIAKKYNEFGFAVAIDHCRNPKRMDAVAAEFLQGLNVIKVLLLPELETNLHRNAARTDKNFDPAELIDTIRSTNDVYRTDVGEDWVTIDNTSLSVEETLESILKPSARS